MKAEVVDMLAFPRRWIADNVIDEECPHAGNFAEQDSRCALCDHAMECEWLYHNDALSGLEQKPISEAISALSFAIEYVDAYVTRSKHTRLTCHCDACTWLRKANALYDEVAG